MHYVQFTPLKRAQRRRKHCALAVVRRTNKQTNKHTQTDRGDYNTLRSLARSVNIYYCYLQLCFNRSILRDYSRLGRVGSYREEPLKNAGARFFTGRMDALPVPEPTISALKKYWGLCDFCRNFCLSKTLFQ